MVFSPSPSLSLSQKSNRKIPDSARKIFKQIFSMFRYSHFATHFQRANELWKYFNVHSQKLQKT